MIDRRFFQMWVVFLLAVATITAKTLTCSGRVVDNETGTGSAGVLIAFLNTEVKTTTGPNGEFSISVPISAIDGGSINSQRNFLLIRRFARILNLKSSPYVSFISIYNVKGERLFFKERQSGSDMQLPGLPRNVYILRIGVNDGNCYDIKWANTDKNIVLPLRKCGSKTGFLSKQATVIGTLEFTKQGYQTKKMTIDNDTIYSSMLVKMKPEIGYGIFNEDTIRTYKLHFTATNLAKLLDYNALITNKTTVNTVYASACLEFEGRIMDSIGIRFRGNQSLWDCISNGKRKKNLKYPQYGFGNGDICAKFSMKFDFNKYNKDFRLYELKALNFRSMAADPTKMHEMLAYSLFNDMGIVTPRIAYARLYVNDSLWGLFNVTEQFDDRFTKVHYPKTGNGNLYKEVWPDSKVTDASILDALKTNNDPEDTPNVSDFKALRDSITATGTDSNNFLQKMSTLLDIPYLVRYIVVDRGIMNFDGIMSDYGGYGRYNYCWYHDSESGLFRLIPWDVDKVFLYPEPNYWTNNKPNGNNKVPNWNVVNSSYADIKCYFDQGDGNTGGYSVCPIDKDKFLRLVRNTTWNDFRIQGKAFLDSIFTQEKVNVRIGRWRTRIAGAVGEDPTIDSTEWAVMVDSLSHTIPLMRTNLKMMTDTLIVR